MKELCRTSKFRNLWMSGIICLLSILVCLGSPNGVMAAPKVAGPTGLTASLNSVGDGATLTWSASELPPDGYLIERSQSATKDFSQILAVSGSTTSVDDSLEAGSGTYYYRVRSYATYGSKTYYSSYTNVADVTVASATTVPETDDTAASVAEYPAPVINSVTVNGDSYELSWSMPSNPYGVPDGGYDIVIDGDDTGTTNRTTATSITISGLDTTLDHTFIVEARWTQVDPAQYKRSSEFLVSAMTVSETDDTAPSVVMTAPSTDLNITSVQTVTLVAAASDNVQVTRVDFYDGTTLVGSDTTNTFSATLSLTEANNGTHAISAVAYDAAGNSTKSASVNIVVDIPTTVEDTPVAEYPAPVINGVTVSGDSYELSWSMPSNPYGVPDGGYDIVIDGDDTGTTNRTTATSTTISGLDTTLDHTFIVEARWTQVDPAQYKRSSEFLVSAMTVSETDDTAPSVVMTAPSTDLNVTSVQTVTLVAAASDNVQVTRVDFYDGTTLVGSDTTNIFSASLSLTEADNGTHAISAVAYDAAGNSTKSASVNIVVDIPTMVAEYPAPVLNSVTVSGDSYELSWSMPSNPYGVPDGGYDIVIDGDDTGTTNRTTATSTTISGLDTTLDHTFIVEARWTQVDPAQYKRSNELSVAADTSSTNDDATTNDATTTPEISGPVKIFPGAEGFGTDSIAGRGGQIIRVTNLDDSGSGSLRAALEASVPRIVVFEVGGVIHLESKLRISNPYCTVAGQTAPGQGIMIRNWGLEIRTHDVLLQHLAIRPGDEGPGPYDTLDGLNMNGSGTYNVVIDHCSISWGIDENFDTWTDVHDVTISNTIISECLWNSYLGTNSKGYLAGRRNKNVAFIKNLMAHNKARNPLIYGDTKVLLANNVFYNAGATSFTSIGDAWSDGPPKVTVVGNIYKAGPGTTAYCGIKIEDTAPSGTEVYEASNYYDAGSVRGGQEEYFVSSPPVSLSGITVKTNENEIMNSVLTNAGARPGNRDAVDNRIAHPSTGEVITGKGSWVDSVDGSGTRAPGGWPTYPLDYRNFDEGENPNGDDNGNGYTNIEEILYQMALQVEGK